MVKYCTRFWTKNKKFENTWILVCFLSPALGSYRLIRGRHKHKFWSSSSVGHVYWWNLFKSKSCPEELILSAWLSLKMSISSLSGWQWPGGNVCCAGGSGGGYLGELWRLGLAAAIRVTRAADSAPPTPAASATLLAGRLEFKPTWVLSSGVFSVKHFTWRHPELPGSEAAVTGHTASSDSCWFDKLISSIPLVSFTPVQRGNVTSQSRLHRWWFKGLILEDTLYI